MENGILLQAIAVLVALAVSQAHPSNYGGGGGGGGAVYASVS